MLYILSPVLLRINPLIDGLSAGPRFPRLLMKASPPAAAPADRYSLVSAKKSGVADAIPMTAKERARIDPTKLPWSSVVIKRPTAAMATQTAKCHRRSCHLSEWRPIRIIPMTPAALGLLHRF